METNELRQKIDLLSEQLTDFEATPLHEIWETKREIFELLKQEEISKEERVAYMADLQPLLDTLDFRQQKKAEESEKFAEEADGHIKEYCDYVDEALAKNNFDKDVFAGLKVKTEELVAIIRQPNWPSKERRTQAWDLFHQKRDAWKQKEDEWYGERREKMIALSEGSSKLCGQVFPLLDLFAGEDAAAQLIENVKTFASANGIEQEESDEWLNLSAEEAGKQSLKVKSGALQFLRRFMINQRELFTRENRDAVFDRLNGLQKEMETAWQEYRDQRKQKQAEWESRRHEHEAKKHEWLQKQQDFLAMLEKRLRDKTEYRAKLQDSPGENNRHIDNIEARIGRQHDYILRLQREIEDLEEQNANAWSKAFKDRSGTWIEEKKQKLATVQKDVDTLNKRLDSLKTSEENFSGKIELLSKEIDELSAKIDEVKQKINKG